MVLAKSSPYLAQYLEAEVEPSLRLSSSKRDIFVKSFNIEASKLFFEKSRLFTE